MAENIQNKITPAQRKAVWDEFQKMGYSPASEGEVDYWAAKPIGNLFSELKKRKAAEPQGKLTNDQLFKLYDEFGLAGRLKTPADYAWAKQNLPNDAESLKKVLKTEQTKQAAAQKAGAQNVATQNNVMSNTQQNPGTITQKKNTTGATGQFNSPTGHLVKFRGDPNGAEEGDASTLWFVDTDHNVMRPIMSMQSFKDIFNNDPATIAAAQKSINTVDTKEVQPGGQYSNFFLLGSDYGVYDGVKAKELDFSPKVISQRYGKPASQMQVKAAGDLDNLINYWENSDSGLDKAQLEKMKNDPTYMAGLIGGLAYGDYSITDVWQEMKRKQAADSGDTEAQKSKVIDASMTKSKYAATDASKKAAAAFPVPAVIAGMDSTMLSQPLVNMPDDFYKTLYSASNYDPTSPDYIAKANAAKSEMHDLVLNQLNAKTDAAKAAADREYEKWRTETEKTLGISLQKNAMAAWTQLEGIIDKSQEAGLAGSGLENEQIDESLKNSRQTDQWNRESTQTTMANKEEERLQKYASPAEIKAMNDEDAAKGLPRSQWRSVKLNLAPPEEMTSSKFLADYRSKYPTSTLTDAQVLDSQYNQYYDENGNLRSSLYQAKEDERQKTMYGNTVEGRTASAGSYTAAKNDAVTKQNELAYKKATEKWDEENKDNIFGSFGNLNATGPDTQAKDIQSSMGVGKEDLAKKLSNRVKIANVAEMAKYDPSQYSRDTSGGVYFNQGLTAATAKKAGTTPAPKAPAGYTPPKGYEAIANSAAIKNYQPNNTITNNKTLYGIPKTATNTLGTKPTTPTGGAAGTTGTKAPAFTPKAGTSYIPDVKSMSNYTNVYKDTTPGSKKLYGTLKK